MSLLVLRFRGGASVRFAQVARFLLLLASDMCQFSPKTRPICSIQKSDFPLFSSTS
ncbi:hypothetical protein SBA2_250004 [Acidobacteriia bacterium SbA2]|nr:hypothetical protein SBA2_250004 [Acidobacteriia bacterium SbA2]